MTNKLSLYIDLNLKDNRHLIINLITDVRLSFDNHQLIKFIDHDIFVTLEKRKYRHLTLFVLNLKNFQDYILKFIDYHNIQQHSFKNKLYCLKYKNALYKNKAIIIKDIIHFIHEKDCTKVLEYINTLKVFAKKILEIFKVDIFDSKILSLTSLSKHLFHRISPESYKLIASLNQREDNFIRQAFYGGRNEIIKPIFENAHFYDINSLYLFIMVNNDMPIGKPDYIKAVTFNDDFYGFIDVIISSPLDITLPILPIKSTENCAEMGIIYPVGTWRGIYFSEELKLAMKHGYKIIKIFDGYSFNKGRIFDAYISKIYSLRKEEKNVNLRKIYKILMNSLYGKYASIYETIKTVPYDTALQVQHKKYENVAISSVIAAHSRMFMYNYIINNNLNLYYWDTDGIIIKNKLEKNVGKDLGQFKLVDEIIKGICLSTKFYFYQTNKNYKYILRSVPLHKYDLTNSMIYEQILHILINSSISSTETNCVLMLKLLNLNQWDDLTFCFHNKRKYIDKMNTINTTAWEIQAL